ncbi:MAG: hypothetical protein AB7G80_05910 [Dongiaceae bacterium]
MSHQLFIERLEAYLEKPTFWHDGFTDSCRKLMNMLAEGLKGKFDVSIFDRDDRATLTNAYSKLATEILWVIYSDQNLQRFAAEQAQAKRGKYLEDHPLAEPAKLAASGRKTYAHYLAYVAHAVGNNLREEYKSTEPHKYPFGQPEVIERIVKEAIALFMRDREAMRIGRELHKHQERLRSHKRVQEVS